MSANATAHRAGQSPPLTVITSTDKGGDILITAALGLIFSLISLLIRIYMQFQFRHFNFFHDDLTALAAMILAGFQSAAVFIGVSMGLGKTIEDISPPRLSLLQKASYASDILYILTVWLTQCSVVYLFFRLSPDRRHNLVSKAILCGATALSVISILITALTCDLSKPWIFIDAHCTGLYTRWQVIAGFEIAIEIALLAMSIFLVQGLRLPQSKKIAVVFAFGLRLFIVAPIALRLHYLGIFLASSDPTLTGAYTSVCTQIHLNYAIMAATIPCLRPFMSALDTGYGSHPAPRLGTKDRPSAPQSNSYSLPKFPKKKGSEETFDTPTTRWDKTEHLATVERSDDRMSVGSQGSKKMIIS